MKICSTAEELRKALVEIKPSKIAVAFVGEGWKKYVFPPGNLKEIILSPTLGSNPKAIEEIKNVIGWENVFFLDKLHSKLYIGSKSSLLGSSNLSDNGFDGSGLFEAGVLLMKPASIQKLNEVFKTYKAKAASQYPTTESKEKRLVTTNPRTPA